MHVERHFFSRCSPYGYIVKTYIAADISDLQISVLFYYFFTEANVIGTHLNGMGEALFICTDIILSTMRFS